MKRAAYFFLLIGLCSCSVSYPSNSNRIKIQFRDSTIADYFLLSVFNHSMLVSPYSDEEAFSLNSARRVLFENIEAVYFRTDPNFLDVFLPGFVLGIAGGVTGYGISTLKTHSGEIDAHLPFEEVTLGSAGGLVGGMILGYSLNSIDNEVRNFNTSALRDLHQRAFYDTETFELQKIK
jgi:hypothetical protein